MAVTVVAAALLDGAGQVLAAQRAYPPELAGRWEFPGGKLEPGESDRAGLVRELTEELGVVVRPLAFVAEVPIPVGRLRLWTAALVSGAPVAREHRSLRWVALSDLDRLPWLAPDVPLLPLLSAHVAAAPGPSPR